MRAGGVKVPYESIATQGQPFKAKIGQRQEEKIAFVKGVSVHISQCRAINFKRICTLEIFFRKQPTLFDRGMKVGAHPVWFSLHFI